MYCRKNMGDIEKKYFLRGIWNSKFVKRIRREMIAMVLSCKRMGHKDTKKNIRIKT
jgi:hypothetical protein